MRFMHTANAKGRRLLGLLGADVPEVYGGLQFQQQTAALIAEKLNCGSRCPTHEAHTVIAVHPTCPALSSETRERRMDR